MDLPEKRRRGRKKKDASEKLEQFTIRLSPRLKFASDVFARLLGRSLSQSIEWALVVAMQQARAGKEVGASAVWDAIEAAWPLTGWERTFRLYQADPGLVEFEERYACELVAMSREYREQRRGEAEWREFSRTVESIWPKLVDDSAANQIAPQLRAGARLIEAAGGA